MTNREIDKNWDACIDMATEYGYEGYSYNETNLGIGSTFFKTDRFVPIINLCVYPEVKKGKDVLVPASMSIHVKDRNGNDILTGVCCAVHTLEDCEDFKNRFADMCRYVFDKYSQYSKTNRLDFVYNELSEERINWNEEKGA